MVMLPVPVAIAALVTMPFELLNELEYPTSVMLPAVVAPTACPIAPEINKPLSEEVAPLLPRAIPVRLNVVLLLRLIVPRLARPSCPPPPLADIVPVAVRDPVLTFSVPNNNTPSSVPLVP